jgi:hypothetical protein
VDTINVASAAIVSGKLYLSLSNGLVIDCGQAQGPQGLMGPPGPPGPNGRPGTDGNGVLHGPGMPLPTDGKQGDFYVDTADLLFYGPKTGAGWGSGVALRPPARSMTLPTGMKAQQGDPIYPRVFAGAMAGGGGSATVSVAGGGGGGVGSGVPIRGNNSPFPGPTIRTTPATTPGGTPTTTSTPTWQTIAHDDTGDALVATVWAVGPNGTNTVQVVAMRDGNDPTLVGHSQVYEVQTGTAPPVLSFTPSVTAGGALELSMSSSVGLSVVRGIVQYL